MKHTLTFTLLLGIALNGSAQKNKNAVLFSKIITTKNAEKHLSILASDSMQGRKIGTKGAEMAAAYIRGQFKAFGLDAPVNGEYFQPLERLIDPRKGIPVLTINNEAQLVGRDFYVSSSRPDGENYAFDVKKILLGGYEHSEKDTSDFLGMNVEGKLVIIMDGDDPKMKPHNTFKAYMISSKLRFLMKHKAAGILLCRTKEDTFDFAFSDRIAFSKLIFLSKEREAAYNRTETPIIMIGRKTTEKMLKGSNQNLDKLIGELAREQNFKPVEFACAVSGSAKPNLIPVHAENVLGFIPGSDPKLKEEVLVLSAHYDHIGVNPILKGDTICNGADDDGSGTTGILMIAEGFAKARKAGHGSKRSVLFIAMTGEEAGLLGSEWYSEHPIFSLQNTITDLNIDMIGRCDSAHLKAPNFVYIIGSNMLSSDLDRIVKKANSTYMNLNLDEKYNNQADPQRFYYRSDHYNFAKHRIPVTFFFNGTHPDYHQPSDEISKIDFPMLVKRAKLVYFTAWELANASQRPIVDK